MFLEQIQKYNPDLLSVALQFHQSGKIPPSCFIVDLDTVAENTQTLVNAARENGLSLYFITKQVGFNPVFAKEVCKNGIEKAVAVDWNEALGLLSNEIPLGHLGHLVQIPTCMIAKMLHASPEVITIFSVEKARQLSQVAKEEGLQANILLRVVDEEDFTYSGQTGGIPLTALQSNLDTLGALPNIKIAGVTAFPCTVFDPSKNQYVPTQNLMTIHKAAEIVAKRYAGEKLQINAPGNSCVQTFPLISRYGATHAEPGNALTGTTPLHAILRQPEKPALIHVTEISHEYKNIYYCYGGGLYRRSTVTRALVGNNATALREARVISPDKTSIDYYVGLKLNDQEKAQVGDSVLWSSRAQLFVTRSSVAIIKGIQQGKPELAGIFNPFGLKIDF
jgi:predicted amino acid racemase